MKEDAQKWNRVFSSKQGPAPTPPEFLTRNYHRLKPGTVLDVASGDGANALFLAEQGFAVTAVDIAQAGLARLLDLAAKRNLEIGTREVDLDLPASLKQFTGYDNLVISRYKPPSAAWPQLVKCLAPEGILALSTFNLSHHEKTGFNRQFCLSPGELESIHPDLKLLHYEGSDLGDPSMDSYLFQHQGTADSGR